MQCRRSDIGRYRAGKGNVSGSMNAAQHLGKCVVQVAQSAVQSRLAVSIRLDGDRAVGVPGSMRERSLLRKKQQQNADKSEQDTLQGRDSGTRNRADRNVNQSPPIRNSGNCCNGCYTATQ